VSFCTVVVSYSSRRLLNYASDIDEAEPSVHLPPSQCASVPIPKCAETSIPNPT